MKDWLPITKRNRVALGYAFLSLVLFVVWNALPCYDYVEETSNGPIVTVIWAELTDPDYYLHVFRSPSVDGFLSIAASMAVLMNGLLVLAIVPFWKILHASNYVRIPVAAVNLAGGLVVFWFLIKENHSNPPPFMYAIFFLMASSMFALASAMLIFRNELGLRHDREVKRMMEG